MIENRPFCFTGAFPIPGTTGGDATKCGCWIDGLNEADGVMVSTAPVGEVIADEVPVVPANADADAA